MVLSTVDDGMGDVFGVKAAMKLFHSGVLGTVCLAMLRRIFKRSAQKGLNAVGEYE